MIHLKFRLDPDRITLNQVIDMQDGNYRAMRDVLAACLVNGTGEYVEHDEAIATIGGLPLSQIQQAAEEFTRQVKDAAVNPTNGAPSSAPSSTADVALPGSES